MVLISILRDGRTHTSLRTHAPQPCLSIIQIAIGINKINDNVYLIKVPRMGVEPTRPKGHMALNHACLPIPAPRYFEKYLN